MKKTFLLGIILLLAVALLCACGGGSNNTAVDAPKDAPTDKEIEESILGAWQYEDDNVRLVYIFQEGGTGYAALFPMTYSVKDGVITVTVEAFGKTETDSVKYSVDGDTLSFEKEGKTRTMTRTEIPEEYKEKLGL